MLPVERRQIGQTDLTATAYGFGAGPLGNRGKVRSDEECRDLVRHAWEAGVRLFDTAPMYGHGLAENRLGSGLRAHSRDDYVLSTKVGRILEPAGADEFDTGLWLDAPRMKIRYDYSYDGAMRSIEDSLQRMLTDRIDIALIHDCDMWTHGKPGKKPLTKQWEAHTTPCPY